MSIIEKLERFVPLDVEEVTDEESQYTHRVSVESQKDYIVDLGIMDAQETLRNGNYPNRVEQRTEYNEDTETYYGAVLFEQ